MMNGENVLIVENDRILAEDLALILEEMGYGVCGRMATGEAAIERVARGDVDIVIMDIKLDSAMDGIEAAGKIRAIADIPLIFLTAYADDVFIERAKDILPYGYLIKPYRCRELQVAMALALHRHERQKRSLGGYRESEHAWQGSPTAPGIIAICSTCRKIRNPEGAWETSEAYFERRLPIRFSHSVCPQCAARFYPDFGLYE